MKPTQACKNLMHLAFGIFAALLITASPSSSACQSMLEHLQSAEAKYTAVGDLEKAAAFRQRIAQLKSEQIDRTDQLNTIEKLMIQAQRQASEKRWALAEISYLKVLDLQERQVDSSDKRIVNTREALRKVRTMLPPRFDSYPATLALISRPSAVDLDSHPEAQRYRSMLRNGQEEGPNFAGDMTVVSWGCGTACTTLALISVMDGKVAGIQSGCGEPDFSHQSRLLIWRGDNATEGCATRYLLWDGKRLAPLPYSPN